MARKHRKPVIPMPSAPGIAAKFWIEPRDPAKLGEGDLGPDAEVDHAHRIHVWYIC